MKCSGRFPLTKVLTGIFISSLLVTYGDNARPQPEKKPPDSVLPQSENKPAPFNTQINSAPLFESQQGWGPGFAKAIGHGPGVVVGPGGENPNVFAQQFAAKPNEQFKVVARASSVSKANATGRFQINWTDAGGQFISASIKAFKVTPEVKVFEEVFSVPATAINGTLYVVADGPADVVRYTEMRLLGRGESKANSSPEFKAATSAVPLRTNLSSNAFPKPPNLTPLDGISRTLTVAESQYYFYQAAKTMQRKANERGMDFIMYVMPDYNISRLMPAIQQLRSEGIKVLAYAPQANWSSGVDAEWYWQKADSHWTEAAVRLTADEILRMWKTPDVTNRPFSTELQTAYTNGFPENLLASTNAR